MGKADNIPAPAVKAAATECRKCGACCRFLIVEAEPLDVLREPRIAQECLCMDGRGTLPEDEWVWSLSAGNACPFLTAENLCGIYPTRPNTCVGFEPGSEQCQAARAGLLEAIE